MYRLSLTMKMTIPTQTSFLHTEQSGGSKSGRDQVNCSFNTPLLSPVANY